MIERYDSPEISDIWADHNKFKTYLDVELALVEALEGSRIPEGIAQTIKSKADKEVAIILAEARKTSQILRGEGDGLRNKIFAEAFGRDPEFFSFYRAMQSYEKSLINGSETSLVLSPDSEFFRYFGESGLNKILKR